MPLLCPNGFNTCTTTLEARERLRKPNTDGVQYALVPPSNDKANV